MKNFTEEPGFIVHYFSPTKGVCHTHTEGLAEIGFPEFIVNRNVFSIGNIFLIISAYGYFSKPENAEALNSIMAGETVTIDSNTLEPEEYEESYNFCFRSVNAEFEMVKEAYEEFDPETLAQMQFVEIYIEEDGFGLEDD